MPLRRYQKKIVSEIYKAWGEGKKCVMPVLPTGGGKTKVFTHLMGEYQGPSCAIAHRQELVSQISLALGYAGVRHRLIAADQTIKTIRRLHMSEMGRVYVDEHSQRAVAGVDTLVKRDASDHWFARVGLGVQDEGHHVLQENKWGDAYKMFPNAHWLLPTATPLRADGKGCGRDADGFTDAIIEGPSARELINEGFLTDYRIFGIESDIDYSQVPVTASGDLSPIKLSAAFHESGTIVGDIVKHYLKLAPGKLGITFAVDVEAAKEIAAAFRNAGVPAEVITAKTPVELRASILRRFKNREVLQLVNVDLFGEGFDLPALEVVSMARKTESFGLFCQQFGRALRLMIAPELMDVWDELTVEQRLAHIAQSSKPHAIIIDHVGNVIRHGLPDAARTWSLARRERRSRGSADDVIPVRNCLNPACMSIYERIYFRCPYCHWVPTPPSRTAPEHVDGDLTEYDPELLRRMRGEATRAVADAEIVTVPGGLSGLAAMHYAKHAQNSARAQVRLRASIALWAGYQRHLGRPDSEAYRRFYFMFGIDILGAQSLRTDDAEALNIQICSKLANDGVVSNV